MRGLATELQKAEEVPLPQQLQAHGLWLATEGQQGSRLDLSGQTVNQYRFEGLDLRSAILQGADLRDCRFQNANLEGAQMEGADLRHCDFRESDLRGASLKDANLDETSFPNADLSDADLSGARCLLPQQLAGTKLAGARLPDSKTDFCVIHAVDERSKQAQILFLSLLSACIYSWLTVGSTTDFSLVSNIVTSELPIINTSIPIVWFYRIAPLLLTVFFLHFLLYTQRLWEAAASLPAVLPDGVPIDQRVHPWYLIGLVRAYSVRLGGGPALFGLQLLVSIILTFWAAPITVGLLWVRYLTRQDWAGTVFHCMMLGVCLWAASAFAHLCVTTLRDRIPKETRSDDEAGLRVLSLQVPAALTMAFLVLSYGSIEGVRPSQPLRYSAEELLPTHWVPRLFTALGYSPFAEIDGAELSQKPPNWKEEAAAVAVSEPVEAVTSPGGLLLDSAQNDPLRDLKRQLEAISPAKLNGVHLRYGSAVEAFLAKADMWHADLTAADLYKADLRLLNANVARYTTETRRTSMVLRSAILSEATLTGAYLRGADLRDAELADAILTRATLLEAHLEGANLSYVDANYADLEGAFLTGAKLLSARLNDAVLCGAQLSANLEGAYLRNANLSFADLTNANLVGAQLQGANLEDAILRGADIQAANLEGAQVSIEQLLSAENWRDANLSPELKAQLQKYKHEPSQ
jgi:uncharacterized protein YjbI with pentapeptide repeats